MNRIKAVLFDFDGTLADTNGVIIASWHHVYDVLERPYPPLSAIVKTFGEDLFKSLAEAFPDKAPEETAKIYREYMSVCFKDVVHLFDGMEQLVRTLHKRGYALAIVTSRHWETIRNMGYDFPVEDLFDVIISGEDCTAFKPDPQPCHLALERLGVHPAEAIMVGDSRLDILCGKNAGVHTALVGWSMAFPREKAVGDFAPDLYLEKPEDLLSGIAQIESR